MKNTLLFSFFMILALGQAFAQTGNIDCNDTQAIRHFFLNNGFESTPVTVVSTTDKVNSEQVKDFAQLVILRNGENVNMAEVLQSFTSASASEGFNAMAIVTKNENFCDQAIKQIINNDFDKHRYDASVNAHIWDRPNSTDDLLFIRYNPINTSK